MLKVGRLLTASRGTGLSCQCEKNGVANTGATSSTYTIYNVTAALQRPLVFKLFKGKYIYWAAGCIAGGVLLGGLASSIFTSFIGIVTMIGVTIPGLLYTIAKHKKEWLIRKKKIKFFIVQPTYKISWCPLDLKEVYGLWIPMFDVNTSLVVARYWTLYRQGNIIN